MPEPKLDKESWGIAAVLLVLGGTLLRFWGLGDRQLWLDEILQLKRFSGPSLIENVLELRHEIAAAPLGYLIQNRIVTWFGTTEFTARLHAAVFGSLSLPLFFALGKRLFNHRTATLGLLLFAVFPLHHQYSQEGRNYALFVLLTLVSFSCLLVAIERGGTTPWVAFGISTVLNLHTHYFGCLALVSELAFVLALESRPVRQTWSQPVGPRPRVLVGFGVSAGTAVALFLPWLVWSVGAARADAPSVFEPDLLWRLFKELSGGYPLSLLGAVCWGLGLKRLIAGRRWANLALLLSWGVLPFFLVLGLVWWRQYILSIRQFLFMTPALLLMAAAGLDGLYGEAPLGKPRAWLARSMLAGIVVLSLGTIFFKRGKEEPADWKGLAFYLRRNTTPGESIAAPSVQYPLTFYLRVPVERWIDLEQAERKLSCQDPRADASLVLVVSRYMTPAQGFATERLRQSSRTVRHESFQGFQVFHLRCLEE